MTRRPVFLSFFLVTSALLGSVPAPATAQEASEETSRSERPRAESPGVFRGLRMSGFFQVGLLGQARLRPEVDTPGDIGFSYGGEMRISIPVLRYLNMGGAFGFRRFRTEGGDRDGYGRSTFFQASLILQPRIPITLRNGKLLELALTLPVGLGITSPSQNWAAINGGAGPGFGGLASLSYFIAPRLVWTFEGGWIHQLTWHRVQNGADDVTMMSAGQIVLRIGFGIRI